MLLEIGNLVLDQKKDKKVKDQKSMETSRIRRKA